MVLRRIFNTPHKGLFQSVPFGGILLVSVLLILIYVIVCVYSCYYEYIHKKHRAMKTSISETECPPCLRKCGGSCLRPLLIWVSRELILLMFSGLFRKHKYRCRNQRNNCTITRTSILFLDRKVESNFLILFMFFMLCLSVISVALLLFFRHVPVVISSECRNRDDEFRDLFCYTSESNLPVDCTIYNTTQLEEMKFDCYAISIFELGVAIAAVMALAKIATFGITIYIRASELVYMWSQSNTRRCHVISAKRIYVTCYVVTFAILELLAIVIFILVSVLLSDRLSRIEGWQSTLPYFAYVLLPFWLIPFASTVLNIHIFGKHCDQEEYISCCQDQLLPSCVNDCHGHVESGNDRDELEDLDSPYRASRHSTNTVVENVHVATDSIAVETEQAGRESHTDSAVAPNETDSGLVFTNLSYLTPLLQDNLSTQTSPHIDSQ